ncbi:N-acetylmuramoyl-L-alanine amidase [Geodermatophilus sp. SYSU D00691]
MRRTFALLATFLAVTATVLVLPVYAAPSPEAVPVETSSDEVPMGSVAEPAGEAEVQEGTTEPVAGVADTVPTLTVTETDTDEFSLVGVTWAHDPAVTDTVVKIRVQDGSGNWGDWTEVTVEDAEQNSSADSGAELRGGTSPLWTGPSTGVEAELVTRSGAQPTDVTLDLVDPGESEADGSLGAADIQDTADAAMAMPAVYSRAQWGADESIRTWDPEYASTLKAATVHHTADSNNYTADEVPAIMRSIYRYHTVSRGWGDIGYNVIVDKFGRLWEGRYGGLASTVVGAHAGGFNTYTFGVSMLGNYDVAEPPRGALDAVADIIAWKFSLYGIDPRATTQLTSGGGGTARWGAGTVVTVPTVFGHRDVGNTACPGRYAYAHMDGIRARVAAQVDYTMSAIERRYLREPDLRASLGAPEGGEQYGDGYAWQEYENGRLYWSATAGVHLIRGDILKKFIALGGATVLGVPSTDEGVAGGWGAFNHFEKGVSIYWKLETGAQPVRGGIRERWMALNAEWRLGYPTAAETPVSGGYRQDFTNGSIYWSAATGAAFELRGGIATAWTDQGGLSTLGFPASGEKYVSGGTVQEFSRGFTLAWTPAGTYRVQGGIREAWLGRGGATGALGMPQTNELATSGGGGFYTTFTGGSIVWTPSAGAVVLTGPIGDRWKAAGGVNSSLGLPTGPQRATADGRGQVVTFTSGAAIYHSTGTGAHVVRGGIGARWAAIGGLSRLGFPVTDETALGRVGGWYQLFVAGKIMWSGTTGAWEIYGAIGAKYDSMGAEWSSLGLPTSGEYWIPGGSRQNFQHGTLTYNASTGVVTAAP